MADRFPESPLNSATSVAGLFSASVTILVALLGLVTAMTQAGLLNKLFPGHSEAPVGAAPVEAVSATSLPAPVLAPLPTLPAVAATPTPPVVAAPVPLPESVAPSPASPDLPTPIPPPEAQPTLTVQPLAPQIVPDSAPALSPNAHVLQTGSWVQVPLTSGQAQLWSNGWCELVVPADQLKQTFTGHLIVHQTPGTLALIRPLSPGATALWCQAMEEQHENKLLAFAGGFSRKFHRK